MHILPVTTCIRVCVYMILGNIIECVDLNKHHQIGRQNCSVTGRKLPGLVLNSCLLKKYIICLLLVARSLRCCRRFPVAASRDYPWFPRVGFHRSGFSPCRTWALGTGALGTGASALATRELSRSATGAQLLHSTWNLPGPGIRLVVPCIGTWYHQCFIISAVLIGL